MKAENTENAKKESVVETSEASSVGNPTASAV
jgi:hypothetical protein